MDKRLLLCLALLQFAVVYGKPFSGLNYEVTTFPNRWPDATQTTNQMGNTTCNPTSPTTYTCIVNNTVPSLLIRFYEPNANHYLGRDGEDSTAWIPFPSGQFGKYQVDVNTTSAQVTFSQLRSDLAADQVVNGKKTKWGSCFMRGDFNGWVSTAATLVADYTWALPIATGDGVKVCQLQDTNKWNNGNLIFTKQDNICFPLKDNFTPKTWWGARSYTLYWNDFTFAWSFKAEIPQPGGFFTRMPLINIRGDFCSNCWDPGMNLTVVGNYTWNIVLQSTGANIFKFMTVDRTWPTTIPQMGKYGLFSEDNYKLPSTPGNYSITFNDDTFTATWVLVANSSTPSSNSSASSPLSSSSGSSSFSSSASSTGPASLVGPLNIFVTNFGRMGNPIKSLPCTRASATSPIWTVTVTDVLIGYTYHFQDLVTLKRIGRGGPASGSDSVDTIPFPCQIGTYNVTVNQDTGVTSAQLIGAPTNRPDIKVGAFSSKWGSAYIRGGPFGWDLTSTTVGADFQLIADYTWSIDAWFNDTSKLNFKMCSTRTLWPATQFPIDSRNLNLADFTGTGKYNIIFDDLCYTWSIKPTILQSLPGVASPVPSRMRSLYFRGSFDPRSASSGDTWTTGVAMNLTKPYTWTATVAYAPAGAMFRFTRDKTGWTTTSYGVYGVFSSTNWVIPKAGAYIITFNDDTLSASICPPEGCPIIPSSSLTAASTSTSTLSSSSTTFGNISTLSGSASNVTNSSSTGYRSAGVGSVWEREMGVGLMCVAAAFVMMMMRW